MNLKLSELPRSTNWSDGKDHRRNTTIMEHMMTGLYKERPSKWWVANYTRGYDLDMNDLDNLPEYLSILGNAEIVQVGDFYTNGRVYAR